MSGRTQIRICILILISKQVVKFKVPIIYYLNVCITIPQNAESRYKNSSKEQDPDIRISQKSRIQIKKIPRYKQNCYRYWQKGTYCTYRKQNKLRWSSLCIQLLGVLLTCAVAVGADAVNV